MAKLYVDSDKYGDQPASAVVEAYHNAIKNLVRQRLDEVGGDWGSFVFDKSYDLIGAKDFAQIEKKLLATGHRFDWSAMISVRERPEAYKPAAGAGEESKEFSFEHAEAVVAPPDSDGREQRGIGQVRSRDIAQRGKDGLHAAGKSLLPVLEHVLHRDALQVGLRAAQRARYQRELARRRVADEEFAVAAAGFETIQVDGDAVDAEDPQQLQ